MRIFHGLFRPNNVKSSTGTKGYKLYLGQPHNNILPYKWYVKYLKQYCSELEIPVIATHGLRHSTSELYIHHGATRDDLRRLFAHSTPAITDRYVHDRGTNLERVANVIRIFPGGTDQKVTKSR